MTDKPIHFTDSVAACAPTAPLIDALRYQMEAVASAAGAEVDEEALAEAEAYCNELVPRRRGRA